MTTALAIKCLDGIVLASDRQGTENDHLKIPIDKVFEINKNVGLAGAHKHEWTTYVVDHLKKIPEEYVSEIELRHCLRKSMCELHEKENKPESSKINMGRTVSYNFDPKLLIGAKLKDGEFCIHYIGFRPAYETLVNDVPTTCKIYESKVLGSGASYAVPAIQTISKDLLIDKKLSDLPIDINVGIAMHAVSKAIESDLFSGEDIQIGIVDKKGFRMTSVDEQPTFYSKAVKDLETLFGEDEAKIKKLLPVKIIQLL